MFIIAVISASGVGLIITSNPTIFTVLKFIGAFYLMYLGYKNFIKKSPTQDLLETEHNDKIVKKSKLFYQGLFASLLGEFKHEVRQFQKPYDNQQAEQISLMV